VLVSSRDSAQWIKNTDADGDGVEDNVYGTLRRHQINLTTRATYSFTRDMTVEAYLQPFVAVGDYFDIRKLARPKSFDFTPVALADDPDFNKKSVRGTIVLRWEYVRGSTLFAVWNLRRPTKMPEKASTLRGATFGVRLAPPGSILLQSKRATGSHRKAGSIICAQRHSGLPTILESERCVTVYRFC
jgi:hypothetical protein